MFTSFAKLCIGPSELCDLLKLDPVTIFSRPWYYVHCPLSSIGIKHKAHTLEIQQR